LKIVIAQSFGKGEGFSPGKSNEAIAECIRASIDQQESQPEIYCLQAEVHDALQKILPECDDRFLSIGSADKRITTKKVLDEVAKKIAELKRDSDRLSIHLFGHPDHLPRVMLLARKVFEGANIVSANCEDVPYDSKSIQWWTRNKESFIFFELLSHIHHLLHGYFRREDTPIVLSQIRKHLWNTMKNSPKGEYR
jgi:hypothetical protein